MKYSYHFHLSYEDNLFNEKVKLIPCIKSAFSRNCFFFIFKDFFAFFSPCVPEITNTRVRPFGLRS